MTQYDVPLVRNRTGHAWTVEEGLGWAHFWDPPKNKDRNINRKVVLEPSWIERTVDLSQKTLFIFEHIYTPFISEDFFSFFFFFLFSFVIFFFDFYVLVSVCWGRECLRSPLRFAVVLFCVDAVVRVDLDLDQVRLEHLLAVLLLQREFPAVRSEQTLVFSPHSLKHTNGTVMQTTDDSTLVRSCISLACKCSTTAVTWQTEHGDTKNTGYTLFWWSTLLTIVIWHVVAKSA